MKNIILIISLLGSFAMFAQSKYSEDLSNVRPHVPMKKIELVHMKQEEVINDEVVDTFKNVSESTDLIDEKLAELKQYYTKSSRTRGYRVQVFSGNSKENSEKIQEELKEILKEGIKEGNAPKVYNLYEAPLFRVKVGDYILKERAFYMLSLIKEVEGFENALLVPDLIDVKKID